LRLAAGMIENNNLAARTIIPNKLIKNFAAVLLYECYAHAFVAVSLAYVLGVTASEKYPVFGRNH